MIEKNTSVLSWRRLSLADHQCTLDKHTVQREKSPTKSAKSLEESPPKLSWVRAQQHTLRCTRNTHPIQSKAQSKTIIINPGTSTTQQQRENQHSVNCVLRHNIYSSRNAHLNL